jgi:hypothetical protein
MGWVGGITVSIRYNTLDTRNREDAALRPYARWVGRGAMGKGEAFAPDDTWARMDRGRMLRPYVATGGSSEGRDGDRIRGVAGRAMGPPF